MSRRQWTLAPIPVAEWVSDGRAPSCMYCDNMFTCFSRRHHCRFCGFVVCGACSQGQIMGHRSCESCFQENKKGQTRQGLITSSPALSKVQNLNPMVQYKGPGASARAGSGSLLSSPLIGKYANNVQMIASNSTIRLSERKTQEDDMLDDKPDPSILTRTLSPTLPKFNANDCLIVVDPFSTGAVVVAEILLRGCKVIRMFSDAFPEHIINSVLEGVPTEYVETITHTGDLATTLSTCFKLKEKYNILGCIPGCEAGVELADAIAEGLELRGNGTELSECRRNKYLMNERVRAARIPAVIQARARSLQQVEEFLERMGEVFKIVIKPVASAGSDGVAICRSKEETREHFKALLGANNLFGHANVEVVLQEFLEGKEYVVDTVSRDGVHKCLGIWEYDKRACNGGDFVYFGARPLFYKMKDGTINPIVRDLIEYQFKVLDALGFRNGAGHGEVMYTPKGPRLIEVGARCHGGEGSWAPVSRMCWGYTQIDGLVDMNLDPQRWDKARTLPMQGNWFGEWLALVNYEAGVLTGFGPGVQELQKLPSYLGLDMLVKVGKQIPLTIDVITTPGIVRLVNQNEDDLAEDYFKVHELSKRSLFVVKKDAEVVNGK